MTSRADQTRLGPMKTVNIQQAKTHLSRLVEEASDGEEIVIAKAGRPRVRLVPCEPERSPRPLGGWAGRVWIAADFDETPQSLIDLFEGRGARRKSTRRRRRKA